VQKPANQIVEQPHNCILSKKTYAIKVVQYTFNKLGVCAIIARIKCNNNFKTLKRRL